MCVGIMVVSCTYNSTKTYVYGVLLEVQVPVLKKDFGELYGFVYGIMYASAGSKFVTRSVLMRRHLLGKKDEGAKAMTSRGIRGHLVTVRGWRNS